MHIISTVALSIVLLSSLPAASATPTSPSSTPSSTQTAPRLAAQRSCFMSFKGLERQMCEAYREKKSCFMAFRSKDDRGWCEHLRDGKS